jgi:hypothetical protein
MLTGSEVRMYRRSFTVLVLTSALLAGAAARAADDELPRLDERTALMLGANRVKIGLLSFDYGIFEQASIGTDPPPWAARAFLPVFIPNLHLKASILQRGPVAMAVQGAFYYVALKQEGSASGSLIVVPISLFTSFRLQHRVWLHTEVAYNIVTATGSGDINEAGLNGEAATRAGQAGTILEIRLTRIFSVTALGRYQFYSGPLAFSGASMLDPFTNATINGQALQRVEHPWEAVAGVAFLWPHVHLIVGVGYGYYFVPGIDLPYPSKGFVPDGSLSVVL